MKSLLRQLPKSAACLLAVALCALSALAQETAPASGAQTQQKREVLIERNNVIITSDQDGPVHAALPPMAPMPPAAPMPGYTFDFVSSEMSFDRKVVKGAPYSADALTETVQTLGDGNRIVRKSSAKIYRDGEGRTRRDQTLSAIGPFATSGDAPQMSSINDPVSGISYTLDQRTHTARKFVIRNTLGALGTSVWKVEGPAAAAAAAAGKAPAAPAAPGTPEQHKRVMVFSGGGDGDSNMEFKVRAGGPEGKEMPKPVTESLGKQVVEGVQAEGTRTTFTIPAGEIGNERPIQIVSERWYSPELQTVVMTRRVDPLAGETTYRLTNINRTEPDRSLFEVPADYKIKEGAPVFEFRLQDKKPGENR